MEVPARELIDLKKIAGIPEEFENAVSTGGRVLLVSRFDRGADEGRACVRLLARAWKISQQVFGRYPSGIVFTGAASHNIAAALL